MLTHISLQLILREGEGSEVEFKEKIADLDREIVAFANAKGGMIFLGISDAGKMIGIEITNRLKSQLYDIARNCDPNILIELEEFTDERVLAIKIKEGLDKPYRCKDGFFTRVGPSSQKLTRNEIVYLIRDSQHISFDEILNTRFKYPKDFSLDRFKQFKMLSQIPENFLVEDILFSLNLAKEENQQLLLRNAAVLFFANDPQKFFPESYLTCVCYHSLDRFDILDKKEILGSPIEQVELALQFLQRHMSMKIQIQEVEKHVRGRREELFDYPLVALREALVNAVTHRDYLYDGSHIYVHLFPDRLEIENPGGLYHGLTLENVGKRSVRRNRLIADLLHRCGYIERVGSGFPRMQHALKENNNPPLELQASNFFTLRFQKRVPDIDIGNLTQRQLQIIKIISERIQVKKNLLAKHLHVSEDTILRELRELVKRNYLKRYGQGKATSYTINAPK